MASFRDSFSPPTVGAYRIRPDVGEQEMMVASKLSLKPCRKTQQGFHARKSIAAKRGEVSPLGKTFPTSAARFPRLGQCSCAARQGFPAWKNVPRKPSKVFPLGKVFPTSAARCPRLGKCSPRARQGFPIIPTLKISIAWHVRLCGGRMRYAPTCYSQ